MGFCGCHKILRVYMILGDAVSKLGTFVLALNHISRSKTWSLFTLKASFHVVVSGLIQPIHVDSAQQKAHQAMKMK